ncbi:MAG: helix-turn-helix domain-containing protein [Pseudomonadota bacterium]
MVQNTRTKCLDSAEALFAERGFYGVSLAAIAADLELTKQALLHHFGSKEKLYGAVLKRISDRFATLAAAAQTAATRPEDQLTAYLLQLLSAPDQGVSQTRLLMRELLDNKRRADTAGTWYLQTFLDDLIDRVRAVRNWQDASAAEVLSLVYQLLGAINYFQVSQPTLEGIYGADGYARLAEAYPEQLARLIRAGLTARP